MTQGAWHRQRPHVCQGERGRTRGEAWQVKGRGRAASRPTPAEEGATGRERATVDAGTGQLTPRPKGGGPFSPFNPPETNFPRRPSPPTKPWGRRPPRGGQDARPIRPRCPWHSHRPPAARMNASLRAGGRAARGRRAIVSSDLRESSLPGQNVRPVIVVGQGRIHLGTWAMVGCVARRGACRKALRVGKPPRESLALPQRFLYV